MRIALLTSSLRPGSRNGVATYVHEAARALVSLGHRVWVVGPQSDRLERAYEADGPVTTVRIDAGRAGDKTMATRLGFPLCAARTITELVRRERIDVVEYPESLVPGALLGVMGLLGGSSVPLVASLHCNWRTLNRIGSIRCGHEASRWAMPLLEAMSVRCADAVVSPSEAYAEVAQRELGLSERPVVVRNPLRLPDAPGPIGRKRMLYVGRLDPGKGVESLARSWRVVSAAHPEWELRLVGPDTRLAEDSALMSGALLSCFGGSLERVTLTGGLDEAGVHAELREAACLVLPSRWDNFPYACAEAMACARVVIASSAGGAKEMLGDPRWLFDPDDDEGLGGAMRRVMSMGMDELSGIGTACRERIGALCDPRRTAAERVAVYERAMGVPSRERAARVRAVMRGIWAGARSARTSRAMQEVM